MYAEHVNKIYSYNATHVSVEYEPFIC